MDAIGCKISTRQQAGDQNRQDTNLGNRFTPPGRIRFMSSLSQARASSCPWPAVGTAPGHGMPCAYPLNSLAVESAACYKIMNRSSRQRSLSSCEKDSHECGDRALCQQSRDCPGRVSLRRRADGNQPDGAHARRCASRNRRLPADALRRAREGAIADTAAAYAVRQDQRPLRRCGPLLRTKRLRRRPPGSPGPLCFGRRVHEIHRRGRRRLRHHRLPRQPALWQR